MRRAIRQRDGGGRRRGSMIGAMAVALPIAAGLVGCVRAREPSPPPASPEGVTPIEAEAASERVEGFAPPAALLVLPATLDVDWSTLVPTSSIGPHDRARPLVEPWPDLVTGLPLWPTWVDARPCRSEHYLVHDLRPLRTVEYAYEDGRLARQRIDDDTDGSIELENRYQWSDDGRLVRDWERTGAQPSCDGEIPAFVVEAEHAYDEHGVWLGADVRVDGEREGARMGAVTDYDAQGRPLRWIRFRDTQVERALSQAWDRRGRLRERVVYEGVHPVEVERFHEVSDHERYEARWADDTWTVRRIRLDDHGRPIHRQEDHDGDGVVDTLVSITYDAQGREILRERDADLDGTPESRTEIEYDDAGHRRLERTTGGTSEVVERWTHDAQGRLLRWSRKAEGHWAEDFEEHRYDARGHELERRSERYHAVQSASDLSGYVTREHWRGEYDEHGRLARAFVLEGEVGPNERIEYIYDCREPYKRYPRRNPLDHPETAAECLESFE